MQLGIRLHDVKDGSLEERLAEAKAQGFKCAHVALMKVIKDGATDDCALTPGFAMYVKNQFAKNELDAAVLGCYLNLATPDQEALKKVQKRYMSHIRFASLMGAGVVGTETGAPNVDYHYDKEACHSDEALAIFIKNLRPVVDYAEKMGVIVAIEPVYRHIVWNPKRARVVLDAINSPNLQIIFDPVNMLDISNYQDREAIFDEAMELLGEDIAMVHIKDFQIQDGKIISVAAGTGEMDYSKILKWMKERKPYIHATLEDTVPSNAVFSREYIQNIWDKA